jgi:hypothetical protein
MEKENMIVIICLRGLWGGRGLNNIEIHWFCVCIVYIDIYTERERDGITKIH